MENNFNDEHFESFLQEQLQNHKMFPKDSVWREINHKLHGDKRWPALTFASVFIIGITSFICLHFSTKQNIFFPKPALMPLASHKLESHLQNEHRIGTINYPKITSGQSNQLNSTSSNTDKRTSVNENLLASTLATPSPYQNELNEDYITDHQSIGVNNNSTNNPIYTEDESLQYTKPLPYNTQSYFNSNAKIVQSNPEMVKDVTTSIVANNIPEVNVNNELHTKPNIVNSAKKNSKFNIQLYLAPSISYRKLGEDEAVIKGANNGPAGVSQVSDVNDVVRHKPSKGLEGGISLLYDVRKKLRVKAGFQFNVRQYSIDAYRSNTEISSIALVQNDRIETVNTLVFIRNYNGNSSTELFNRYYQLSMPIGLEWEVVGNKKISFNIAGSIQPTYIINRNAYLLTTNFKNYTENSDFVRKWNVNTNFEAFVSLKVGDVKWQLGPQIRYQPNSTFIARYPIYEHLVDYGIKLGISTNIK